MHGYREVFATDLPGSNLPALIGNTEREAVYARLQEAYADGYLTHEEMLTRIAEAASARHAADLEQAVRQLPVPEAKEPFDWSPLGEAALIGGVITGFIGGPLTAACVPLYIITANSGHGMGPANAMYMMAALIGGIFAFILACVGMSKA